MPNVLGTGESSGKPESQGPHFHNAYLQMGQAIPKKIPNTKHGENKNDVGNFRWGVGGGRSMLRRVTEFKFLRFKDLRTGYTRAIMFCH